MNILTFDIEEWFHILDNDSTRGEESWRKFPSRIHGNVERILTMLDDRGQRATFFCLGWVAQEYPDIVRKISSGGHEIGTHSNLHQLVYEQKIEDFEDDIKKSISILEDVLGEKVLSYRAPGFSIKRGNERVFEILVENGIQVDSSIFPVKRAHGGYSDFGVARPVMVDYKGARLKEFPINSYRAFFKEIIFSGGGYFRFFPYWKIRRMMKNSDYVMTYFHPRDFDPDQPVLDELSLFRKFKSYYGLRTAFKRLESLLDDFEFVDLNSATQSIDWETTDVVHLG